jgi:excinuclease UvrABC nuclease subunit
MTTETPFPEDKDFELPIATASLVGSLMQAALVSDQNESKELFNPQAIMLPKDKEQREQFSALITHIVDSIVEMTSMPETIVKDLEEEVTKTARLRLQHRGTFDKKAMIDLLKSAGFDKSVDKDGEVCDNDEDLSWMDNHPRFRKN